MRSLSEIWRKVPSEEIIQGDLCTHHNSLVVVNDPTLDDDFAVFAQEPCSRECQRFL